MKALPVLHFSGVKVPPADSRMVVAAVVAEVVVVAVAPVAVAPVADATSAVWRHLTEQAMHCTLPRRRANPFSQLQLTGNRRGTWQMRSRWPCEMEVVRVQLLAHPAQLSVIVPPSRLLGPLLDRAARKLHFDPATVVCVAA